LRRVEAGRAMRDGRGPKASSKSRDMIHITEVPVAAPCSALAFVRVCAGRWSARADVRGRRRTPPSPVAGRCVRSPMRIR
jgi:hypothetical protein